jgi:hypothetical protein
VARRRARRTPGPPAGGSLGPGCSRGSCPQVAVRPVGAAIARPGGNGHGGYCAWPCLCTDNWTWGYRIFSSPQLWEGKTAGQSRVVDVFPSISTGICPSCAHPIGWLSPALPQGLWTIGYRGSAQRAYGRVTDTVRPQSRGRVRLRMLPAKTVGGAGYCSIRCSNRAWICGHGPVRFGCGMRRSGE